MHIAGSEKTWKKLQWIVNGCFIVATILLIDPNVAARSLAPWILYFIGNFIWGADSIRSENKPYVWLASFFIFWDGLIICSRLFGWDIFRYILNMLQRFF